jgi:predicted phage-related endonuclease
MEKIFNNHVLGSDGKPITIEDKEEWAKARVKGVSASDINKIVSPTLKVSIQQERLLEHKLGLKPSIDIPNSYTDHGNDREPIVLEWAKGNFGAESNKYLFHGSNKQHFATPDGLGSDFVVEVKTSIKPLALMRTGYMNQMQWQMHVMGVDRCLFIVELHENFKPINIDYEWVELDEKRIEFMVENVNKFIERLNKGSVA